MRIANEPTVFWHDLENDKIRINCDDDLKFFIEESKIKKLVFEYERADGKRKRPSSILSDEFSDSSKKLRRRMEKIDLSSDSSIELSSDSEDENLPEKLEQESVTSTVEEVPVMQSSASVDNEPNVKIISVDIIKEADNASTNEVIPEPAEGQAIVQEVDGQPEVTTSEKSKNERKNSDTNRIVISDSSDDEEDNANARNRRFSDGNYSSAYSFADVNGDRFESRASFDDFRRYRYRQRRNDFDENARRTYQNCSDNMRRVFHHANNVRAQAQAAGDQAMRNLRSSTNFLPDLLSTFQQHFRPLFQPPFNQNHFM